MKFFSCLLIFTGSINLGHAAVPPTLTIGDINDVATEFNVGEGNTDETTSYNHIQIIDTSGETVGVVNNPGANPVAGTKYYTFTIFAPGCATPGDGVVTLNTAYDTDGHLTGTNTVDLELAVAAWGTSNHAVQGDPLKFGVCIQADIMMVKENLEPTLVERKNFDFLVAPILATFTVSSGVSDNTVSVGDSEGEKSGTEITGTWAGSDLLAPGDPIYFTLDIVSSTYSFVGLEQVDMAIGVQPTEQLVLDSTVQDTAMTGSDITNADTELQFYHILPRSAFTGDPQDLAMTGKALVTYTGRRRLNEGEVGQVTEKADFSLKATLMADDGSGSGSLKIEMVSFVIGGIGAIGAIGASLV